MDSQRPLDFRRAAAKELARLADLHERVGWSIDEARLMRDRVVRLGFEHSCPEMEQAVDHLDVAVHQLCEVRRRLDGER